MSVVELPPSRTNVIFAWDVTQGLSITPTLSSPGDRNATCELIYTWRTLSVLTGLPGAPAANASSSPLSVRSLDEATGLTLNVLPLAAEPNSIYVFELTVTVTEAAAGPKASSIRCFLSRKRPHSRWLRG